MRALFVCILVLMLAVFLIPSHNTPFYSQEYISTPSGSQYGPGNKYNFQINWTDSAQGIGGISSAIFETNFSDSPQNYTKGSSIPVLNNTQGTYWINFTGLPAGNYYYKWYSNDTSNSFNDTSQVSYIIQKNSTPISLDLDGTEGNKSYSINDLANFTATFPLSKTIYLDCSYPSWSLISNTSIIYNSTNITEGGSYNLTAYWNGNENYTGTFTTYFFDINSPNFYNETTNPVAPFLYIPNQSYNFSIEWDDVNLDSVKFESNHTGTRKNYTYPVVQNESGRFWVSLFDQESKNFTYRWIGDDGVNEPNSTLEKPYIILRADPLIISIPVYDVIEGQMLTAVCYSITEKITYEDFGFYRDDEVIPNISLLSRFESVSLDIGSYDYVCNTSGNENYTNQSIERTVDVVASSSSSSSSSSTTKKFTIGSLTKPRIKIGDTGKSTFNLTNTYDETLMNIKVNVTGIPSSWYTLSGVPSALLEDGSVIITISFDIPPDTEEGNYPINVKVIGDIEGKSSQRTVSQSVTLTVSSASPVGNEPPSYYSSFFNSSVAGKATLFTLEWVDDTGLDKYIFSTNNSGEWINDSQKSLTGRSYTGSSEKVLTSEIGATVSWKFYASDISGEWVASEEFSLVTEIEEQGFDLLTLFITFVFLIIAVAIVVLLKSRIGETEEVIEYYYTKDDD